MARIVERLRRRGDGGFTLTEMLVAMLILTGVTAALANAMMSSLFATRASQSRSGATQLANETIEQLQGLAWDSTGFYASEDGYTPTYNGLSTVTLPEVDTRDPLVPNPSPTSVEEDGTTYSVQRYIVWRDDAGDGLGLADADGDVNDNKQLFAEVSWTDRKGITRTVTTESLRTATPDEVVYTRPDVVATASPTASADPSVFSLSGATLTPPNQTLTSTSHFSEAVEVSITTSLEASSVRVDYNTTSSARSLTLTSTDNLTWTGTIPAGTGPFAPGALQLTATAISTSGTTISQVVELALTAAAADPIEVTEVELRVNGLMTPSMCVRNSNRRLIDNTVVRAYVTGLDTNDRVDITFLGVAYTATYAGVDAASGGAMYDATIPFNTTVSTSVADMSVNASRTPSDGVAALQPVSFPVVTASGSSC